MSHVTDIQRKRTSSQNFLPQRTSSLKLLPKRKSLMLLPQRTSPQ
jgi:hypothetical protein